MVSDKTRKILSISFVAFVWLIVIALFVMEIIGTPVRISGRSMLPTFQSGDIIYATKISDKTQLNTGDIIITKHDGKLIVKRISACPGDTVVENPQIPLGRVLDSNEYFIVGDNADESYDSRMFGAVTRDAILYKYAGFCIHRPDIWLVAFCAIVGAGALTCHIISKKRKEAASGQAEVHEDSISADNKIN